MLLNLSMFILKKTMICTHVLNRDGYVVQPNRLSKQEIGLSHWKTKTYASVHHGVLYRSFAINASYEVTI